MKIKSDFITNSSSTAYVVFVPPDFKLALSQIQETWGYKDRLQYGEDEGEDISPDDILGDVNESINDLRNNGSLYSEDHHNVFWILRDAFEKLGLELAAVDSAGGDGADTIVAVQLADIKKVLPFLGEALLKEFVDNFEPAEIQKGEPNDVTTKD